ncbi:MAG: molybdopterin-dependent oxidoreductase [Alphaproteobacteria bacterium]|nr:molybdopterin-dependent oxidoreductase [Alphaproteobacteria bacterium]MCB9794453.1 molybdopterin-dependent oxidoreductase [Alphaproteobacteria bacterium]
MLCEAMCGLEVEVEGAEIRSVRGDREDPFSRGHVCPKAVAIPDIMGDPDRLRQPMRRDGPRGSGRFVPISWEEALDEVAQRVAALQKAHGRDAVGLYLGNPTVHSPGAMLAGPVFSRALGSRARFSATSVDQLPQMLAALQMFGHQMLIPIPDIDRADLFVCIGANPVISNGSLMSAPDMRRRLRDLQERGGELIVVDPRFTETAAQADLHLPVRPGGDAALLLGVLHVLFEQELVDLGHLAPFTDGLEALREVAARFPPRRVERMCGLPVVAIMDLADRISQAERGVVYGRFGASTQAFGGLTAWLVNVINAVTCKLDTVGGAMFTHPAADLVAMTARSGDNGHYGIWRSRVRGLPEFGGELPAATLAEEIATPGEGQIRGLLTFAGNPVLSLPDGPALERALGGLEFMASVDLYVNETTRFADIILPTAFGFERDHYDLVFNVLAVRDVARFAPALVPPPPGVREDFDLLLDLAQRIRAAGGGRKGVSLGATMHAMRAAGLRRVLDGLLRSGPHGAGVLGPGLTLARLTEHPSGVDLGALSQALPERLQTEDKRLRLAPEIYLEDLPRLEDALQEEAPELVLIGRRLLRSNNSWMHNSQRLVRGKAQCVLLIHPEDADAIGLLEDGPVRVTSEVGSVEVPARISEEVSPGVVSLPHGFGHGRAGVGWTTAAAHAGVSVNDLNDARRVDPLTGVAAFSGLPVEVAPL